MLGISELGRFIAITIQFCNFGDPNQMLCWCLTDSNSRYERQKLIFDLLNFIDTYFIKKG